MGALLFLFLLGLAVVMLFSKDGRRILGGIAAAGFGFILLVLIGFLVLAGFLALVICSTQSC